MEKRSDGRFLQLALPLATVAFLAVAAIVWFLPEIRLSLAQRALEAGDYARALAWIEPAQTEPEQQLYETCRYEQALALEAEARYVEAREILLTLPGLPEAAAHLRDCDYALALLAYDAGDYEAALAALAALNGYRDSLAYIERCRLALAETAYAGGESVQAVAMFLSVGTEAAERRAGEIAMEITGLPSAEQALLAVRGLDETTLARWDALRLRRESLPGGVLAVGFAHTLGLCPDGTAVAAGDDGYGQCRVQAWTELTMVAAGAYHSVGLRKDGTVVAVGDNRYGQCEVTAWRNVVEVVAGDFDTIARTADGEILSAGYHDYSADAAQWPADVRRLAAGGHVLAALRENGTMLASHASSRADALSGLVDLAVQAGYAAGLCADGTVAAYGFSLPEDWTDVVALSGSATRLLALTTDGAVLEHAFQARNALGIPVEGHALAVAAGGTHAAVLLDDGSVRCFGDGTSGQCDTGTWTLRTAPDGEAKP